MWTFNDLKGVPLIPRKMLSDVITAGICVFADVALTSDFRMLVCACNNVSTNYNNYGLFTHCNKMKRLFWLKESFFTSSFICHFYFHLLQSRKGVTQSSAFLYKLWSVVDPGRRHCRRKWIRKNVLEKSVTIDSWILLECHKTGSSYRKYRSSHFS